MDELAAFKKSCSLGGKRARARARGDHETERQVLLELADHKEKRAQEEAAELRASAAALGSDEA